MTVTLSTVPVPVDALDQVIVGDDIAVGRNDEARAERTGLAGLRRLLILALALALAVLGTWPPKRRKNSSNGSTWRRTGTRCLVEILTTAGARRAARSAKDVGAPARGDDRGRSVLRDLRTGLAGRD